MSRQDWSTSSSKHQDGFRRNPSKSYGSNRDFPRNTVTPMWPKTDAELESAIAQQQSAYAPTESTDDIKGYSSIPRPDRHVRERASPPSSSRPSVAGIGVRSGDSRIGKKYTTVKRVGGGQKWEDSSLLEWDPSHFRLFVGNLSGEVTDEMLSKAFQAFPSVSKVKVVMDPRTMKVKGYGFVSFKDPEDYFAAFKQINGKYIGNHPVQLRKATTEIKPSTVKKKNNDRRKGK